MTSFSEGFCCRQFEAVKDEGDTCTFEAVRDEGDTCTFEAVKDEGDTCTFLILCHTCSRDHHNEGPDF